MGPVIIRASRWRQITPLLVCVAVLIVSPLYVIERDSLLLHLAIIAVFGGGVMYFLSQLWEAPNRLVIDDDGVWYSGWNIGIVRWEELKEVFVRSENGKDFICFSVSHHEELL